MAIRVLAHSAGGADAVTIDHHGLLDDAARLAEVIAEAADDPHLLWDIPGNSDVDRPRAAQERIKDFRAARAAATPTATAARACAGTSSRSAGAGPTASSSCCSGTRTTTTRTRASSASATTTGTTTARTRSASATTTGTTTTTTAAATTTAATTATAATAAATTATLALGGNFLQWPVTVIHQVWRKEVQRQRGNQPSGIRERSAHWPTPNLCRSAHANPELRQSVPPRSVKSVRSGTMISRYTK
jgi:hypothetical protein